MTQVTGGKINNKHAGQNVLSIRPLNNTQPWKFEEGRIVARKPWKFPSLEVIDLTVISDSHG